MGEQPGPLDPRSEDSADVDRIIATVLDAAQKDSFRVWSVVITIFGDIVRPRGDAIPMAVLQRIAQSVFIEPGALRTAVSRLVKDSVWLVRQKQGRSSIYTIAPGEYAAFDRAARRIYASGPPVSNGQWLSALLPPLALETDAALLRESGFLEAGDGLFLWPLTQPAPAIALPSDATLMRGTLRLSDRARANLAPPDLNTEFARLIERYQPLMRAMDAGGRPSQRGAVAARVLLVHHWRRLVLRHPDLSRDLHPADWLGEEARELVARLYRRLLPHSELWLDRVGYDWPSPAGDTEAALKRRF